MSEFKYSQKVEGTNLILAFEGTIDEDVVFPVVDVAGQSQVTIDLMGIKTINSVGIREWLNWIKPLSESSSIVLMNCPKAMVFQFNMVEGFLPARSTVASFYVPFYCEKCDREDNVLFKVGEDVTVADGGELKISVDAKSRIGCAEAPCETEMDVTEAKYFQFLKKA